MLDSIQNLLNFLGGWFEKLWTSISKPWAWCMAMVAAVVVAPVNYVFDVVEWMLGNMESLVTALETQLSALHVDSFKGSFSAVSGAIADANAWVPASLAITVAVALTSLYLICMGIRLFIRCLGAISGG